MTHRKQLQSGSHYTAVMYTLQLAWWCNGKASDSRSNGCEYGSRLGCYQVTTLGKLFTLMCFCYQTVQVGTGETWEVNRYTG